MGLLSIIEKLIVRSDSIKKEFFVSAILHDKIFDLKQSIQNHSQNIDYMVNTKKKVSIEIFADILRTFKACAKGNLSAKETKELDMLIDRYAT